MRKLVGCLSSLSGKKEKAAIIKPQCFRLELLGCLAELENDPGKKLLRTLENGATIGYKSDMGNCPEGSSGETKQRVYDGQPLFLGNYKTVSGKEEALRGVIDKDWGGVSGIGAFRRV